MWIVLSFTACLVSSPAQCETRELAFSADSVTVTQCQHQGVVMLAQWAVQHPRWQISGGYRCSSTRGREMEVKWHMIPGEVIAAADGATPTS